MRHAFLLVAATALLIAPPAVAGDWDRGLLKRWEQEILKQGDVRWVNDVVVSLMATARSDAERQKWLDDYEVDLFDWYCGAEMNAGNFYRMRGIRTSCAEEYQFEESLQFNGEDTVRLFGRNGLGLSVEGKPFPVGNHYTGAWYMDLNAPKWREVVKQGLLRPGAYGDSVTQDNIGVALNHSTGFCQWNLRAFRQWLRERHSPDDLRRLGVTDLDRFDVRAYLLDLRNRAGRESILENPLARQWILFQYVSNLAAWAEMVRDTKAEAIHLGRSCPAVYGNLCRDVVGLSPYQVAQCALGDVVWIETAMCQPGFVPSASARCSLTYKVGWAAGRYRKPVWNVEYPGNHGYPGGIAAQIVMAEAQANGGLCYVGFGPGFKDYQQFFGRQRALFADRQQYAKVALVYSIPGLGWRSCTPFHGPWIGREHFCAVGRILEDLHIPYEVLCFGHPDLWEDAEMLARLSRYDAVLLPAVDCMTDAQAAAIAKFSAHGGKVITCGPLATRDEDFHRRRAPALKRTVDLVSWTSSPNSG